MDLINTMCQIVIAIATAAAAVFAIYLYRKTKADEDERYWNLNLPVVTLGSPCNVNQSACDENIAELSSWDPNGTKLFSLGNFSKATAYNLVVKIKASKGSERSERELFYQEIPVTVADSNSESADRSNAQHIFSKYHIDPTDFETKYDEYDIKSLLENCENDCKNQTTKDVHIEMEYQTCPDEEYCKKILSQFIVKLQCFKATEIMERSSGSPEEEDGSGEEGVKIISIVRTGYRVADHNR